jgi:CheY-like chemotaxis protein
MTEQSNGQLSKASPTILVVDDERSIIKLCKALLEGAGFTVLEADGSSDALKICCSPTWCYRHLVFNSL